MPVTPGVIARSEPGVRLFGELPLIQSGTHGGDVKRRQIGTAEHHARAAGDRQLDAAFDPSDRIIADQPAQNGLRAPQTAVGVHAVRENPRPDRPSQDVRRFSITPDGFDPEPVE